MGSSSSADQLIGRNVNATWTIQGINQGNILDSGVSTPFTFSGFENLTGGNNNDEFVIQPGGRLTGNLLGTVTTGVSDSDKVNLASHATALRVNLTGINSGNVQAASTLATFSSIENVQTGDGDDYVCRVALGRSYWADRRRARRAGYCRLFELEYIGLHQPCLAVRIKWAPSLVSRIC